MSTSKTAGTSIDEALLAEFDTSGESAAGFARRRGIAPWRMYYALDRRAGRRRSGQGPGKSAAATLLPVRVVRDERQSQASALELELAGGHRLRIGADFDPELLRRVLGALERC